MSSASSSSDPVAKLFFNPQVQESLKSLTGMNYEKIFRVSRRGQKVKAPEYVFMTDDQLQKAQTTARQKAEKLLQMPPVMSERKSDIKGKLNSSWKKQEITSM